MRNPEQRRIVGVVVMALGILAAFFVYIGVGYRATNAAGSPISDTVLVASIVVLIASIVAAILHFRRPPAIRMEPLDYTFSDVPKFDSRPEILNRPEYAALDSQIQALARRIGAPEKFLPNYGISMGNGIAHIEIEGDTYHYVNAERGMEYSRFTTTLLEDLLYMVFRDVAFSMAIDLARPKRKPGTDYRRTMFPEQIALLEQLNPDWARRCAAEHVAVLEAHPFIDGKGP